MKIFPIMAASFAMASAAEYVFELHPKMMENMKNKDFTLMEVLHHYSSGMKCVFTQTCVDSLLIIRQCLGGAGYTAWSGIPQIFDDESTIVTYEGDNTLMAQQSFSLLLKMAGKAQKGKANPFKEKYVDYIMKIFDAIKL